MASTLESQLLSQLECPVCYETMSAPIHQCIGGHNICGSCRNQVQNVCPTCRKHIGHTRNYALENIAETMPKTCPHEGCDFTTTVSKEQESHEDTCKFAKHPCPLSRCDFLGLWSEMIAHAEEKHQEKLFRTAQFQIPHFEENFQENVYLFAREADLFKITEKLSRKSKNSLEILAEYLGPAENIAEFRYKVEITDEKSNKNSNVAVSAVKPYKKSSNKHLSKKIANMNLEHQQQYHPQQNFQHHQYPPQYHPQQNYQHQEHPLNPNSQYHQQQQFVSYTNLYSAGEPSCGNRSQSQGRGQRSHKRGSRWINPSYKQSGQESVPETSEIDYVMSFSYSFIRNFCKDGTLSYNLRLQKQL